MKFVEVRANALTAILGGRNNSMLCRRFRSLGFPELVRLMFQQFGLLV